MAALDRLCGLLIRRRWIWLLLAIVLTVAAWPLSRQLTFDQSIESLYARDNPRLVAFLRSKAAFGGDEFLIVAYRDPELFETGNRLTEAARERIESLANDLSGLPGIDPASIQHLAAALRSPYGRGRIREFVTGILLGPDQQTTAVMARLTPEEETPVPRAETFRRVREVAAAQPIPAVVVGEPIQVHDMFRYVEEDGSTLGFASSLLLMLVILILFRSLRWMVLPWLVVQATLIWTKALLVLCQFELSMVSSMLDSLVTIIGIATVMHVTLRFRELSADHDRVVATELSVRQLAVPVFWTTATTAAGFAALLVCHVTPVASFGLMMTFATMIVLAAAALILPGGILIGPRTAVPASAPAERSVKRALDAITDWVEHRPWTVGVSMLLVTSFYSLGFLFLHVETDFSKNFRAHSPIVQALNFFETNLGGAGTWEVNFPAPQELDSDYLAKVRSLGEKLRALEQREGTARLTKVVVLTDGLDLIPSNLLFTTLSLETRLNLLEAVQSDFAAGLYNPEASRMRIMLRSLERQPSDQKLALIAEVEQLAREQFGSESEATGLFVLLTYLIESLMDDQLTSSLLASIIITLMMIFATRSLVLGTVLLIPNFFPVAFVIGTMGWLGLKINIASAMIACVSMGLTIDSSILYIDAYRAARQQGLSFSAALRSTNEGVGLAILFSNLALVIGFIVLTLSHFVPLIYFGVLVSVAMVGGLIGNLVLLPLLLRVVDNQPPRIIPAPEPLVQPQQSLTTGPP